MPELAALVRAYAGSAGLIRAYVGTQKVAEMRDNLCTNPNFELNANGYVGDAATIVKDVNAAHSGFGGGLVTPSVVGGGVTRDFTTVAGRTYTISAWFRSPAARTAQIYVGGIGGTGAVALAANVWQRLSHTFVATGTTTTIYFSSQSTTGPYHLDEVMLEPSATLRPYFDGGTAAATGHGKGFWVGAADASASKMWGIPLA